MPMSEGSTGFNPRARESATVAKATELHNLKMFQSARS